MLRRPCKTQGSPGAEAVGEEVPEVAVGDLILGLPQDRGPAPAGRREGGLILGREATGAVGAPVWLCTTLRAVHEKVTGGPWGGAHRGWWERLNMWVVTHVEHGQRWDTRALLG